MCPKAHKFSGKKLYPQAYLVKKLGRCAKRVGRESLLRQSKKLDNYKPMSIVYLTYLIKLLKRRMKIWSGDNIICSFGKYSETPSFDIKYVESHQKYVHNNVTKIGHFVLKNGKDAPTGKIYPNDCLLQIISAQSGIRPDKLWREITRKVRKLKSSYRMKNRDYNFQGSSSLIIGQ